MMITALSVWQIAVLAVIQGLAELLPVSSSAHVILAQKLMGLDPASPEMTFLLVMLHTGTMFAVLLYFGKRWAKILTGPQGGAFVVQVMVATACTGVLGLALKVGIEKILLERLLHHGKGEVEQLFGYLPLIAASLAGAGILILVASHKEDRAQRGEVTRRDSVIVGLVQGLCLPFRGFSRSGATISTAMLGGVSRMLSEDFSFALAVVLTPPVILQELHRLSKATSGTLDLTSRLGPGAIGMVFSFAAGLVALRWLSSWLEKGRWRYFGIYCLVFAAVVLAYALLG